MLPPDLLHYICQFLGTQKELTRLRLVGKTFLQVIDKKCLVYWRGRPRYDLPNLQSLDCSYQGLTQLTVPKGLRILYCSRNRLTQLIVPEGLRYLSCWDNQLTQLTVPKGIRYCNQSNNPFVNNY